MSAPSPVSPAIAAEYADKLIEFGMSSEKHRADLTRMMKRLFREGMVYALEVAVATGTPGLIGACKALHEAEK